MAHPARTFFVCLAHIKESDNWVALITNEFHASSQLITLNSLRPMRSRIEVNERPAFIISLNQDSMFPEIPFEIEAIALLTDAKKMLGGGMLWQI
jgi:hypothetical protein